MELSTNSYKYTFHSRMSDEFTIQIYLDHNEINSNAHECVWYFVILLAAPGYLLFLLSCLMSMLTKTRIRIYYIESFRRKYQQSHSLALKMFPKFHLILSLVISIESTNTPRYLHHTYSLLIALM